MTEQHERERFEAWAKSERKYHGDDLTKSATGYCHYITHAMWQAWKAARANSGWLPISDEAKKYDFVELYYDHGSIELATFQQGYWRQKCDHSLMLTPYGITHYRVPTPPKTGE